MEKNNGGPAFPVTYEDGMSEKRYSGMTLRQWYAGMALNGWAANPNVGVNTWTKEEIEKTVAGFFFVADAMIHHDQKEAERGE